MYLPFFGLKQTPFSIAPDPHYLFMSERHREALAHLLYGVGGGGGFVLLTGEIGAGKTTVCRCFLDQMPADCNVAYIFNPKLSVIELLQTVCDEFRVPVPPGAASVKDFVDPLNSFLLAQHAAGRNNVLIVDEAQNLSAEVLEQLRLLTNLETRERKLLQVVLIGQPELRDMLARPELEQLAQRVIARYHLGALSEAETTQYVEHRLRVAGLQGPLPLDRAALRRVHAQSRGVPRRINLVCDRALLGAYALGVARVTAAIVYRAAAEVLGDARTPRPRTAEERASAGALSWSLALGAAALAVIAAAAALAVAAWVLGVGRGAVTPPASAAAASAPVSSAASAVISPTPPASAPALPEVLQLSDWQPQPGEAWPALAHAWGLTLPPAAEPCAAVVEQGLQCYRNVAGSLSLIRLLDRPVLLRVQLPGGDNAAATRTAEVTLLGLDAQHATLLVGGQPRRLPLEALAQVWRGEFTTLWRVPPGYANRAENGAALSAWVSQRLAQASGVTADAEVSNASLTPSIQAFQARQGVQPDGLLGPITLMLLNRASGVAEPALAPTQKPAR